MPHDVPVYIIDDEPEMCRSLSLLLSTGGVPARTFGSADIFLDMLGHLPAGVVICDVAMPGTSGLDLVRLLGERGRSDPVVIIAGHADVALAVDAMKGGALDFLEKPFEAAAILEVVAGARRFAIDRQAPSLLIETLSRRERQVLELIMAGLTSKEAARRLGISPRTVETYRTKLMEKTGASGTAQLVRLGLESHVNGASVAQLGGRQL